MDLITHLLGYKRQLLLAAFVGALLGLLIVPLRRPWYESTVRLVVVPAEDPTRVGSSNAIDDATATLPMLVAVLHSRSVADKVVERLHLQERYRVTSREAARAELWRRVTMSTDRRSNFVVLTAEDREPRGAKMLAGALAETALSLHEDIWGAQDRRHQRNLEERLAHLDVALERAEDELRHFRQEHHLVELTEQVKASVAEAATLEHVRLERKLALDFARGYGGPTAPEVQRAQREQRSAAQAVAALARGTSSSSVLLPLDQLPELEVRYARLRRAVDTELTRRELITTRLAQLELAAARPAGRAELVDAPDEPRRPTSPSPLRTAALGTVIAPLVLAFYLTRRSRIAARRARHALA
jgi:uncharacterized protein involved in exopolysaccharide biosynthesis